MDERADWRVVCYRDGGLVATQQVLEGSGHCERCCSDICLLEMPLKNWQPLSIGMAL